MTLKDLFFIPWNPTNVDWWVGQCLIDTVAGTINNRVRA